MTVNVEEKNFQKMSSEKYMNLSHRIVNSNLNQPSSGTGTGMEKERQAECLHSELQACNYFIYFSTPEKNPAQELGDRPGSHTVSL